MSALSQTQGGQRIAPSSRIVYVNNDPVVPAHARALLTSTAEGKTGYVQSDLRDTDAVLAGAAGILDFSQPIAVLLFAVLHFIPDADDPYTIVKRLMDAMPAGSYLVICQAPSDRQAAQVAELARRYNASGAASVHLRSHEEVTRFFDGLDLIGPGVVPSAEWVSPGQSIGRSLLAGYVGVARKPSE
jgi:S-adenosyl methyltransferase